MIVFNKQQNIELPIGDVWITGKDTPTLHKGSLIIKIISMRDFEESIFDKSYIQIQKQLTDFCKENEAKPIYILEGSSGGCLGPPRLIKYILKHQCTYGIGILESQCAKSTDYHLECLQAFMKEDPTSFE